MGNIKTNRFNPTKRYDDKTTIVATNENEDVYLVEEYSPLTIVSDGTLWIIDSGASFHVTPHGDFLATNQCGEFGNFQMGNQGRSKIVEKGDVILTSNTGCKIILKDVRQVHDMRLNLISTGKLDDAGLENHFGEGKWKLIKGNLFMARRKKEGSLYVTQAKLCKEEVNVANVDMELWHRRLGHMSEKGLNILARNKSFLV
ncbi:unnamed protein product [Arabis nemorensis]|uniref:Uncharacterized protein n=1 Tax=Arabis nemorensis TaxID=586526 RepID=A0A565AZL6_9BRAS|nr:unnamed protein product [Arabis nemorensis]